MLGKLTPEQQEALNRAETHLGKTKAGAFGLGKWLGEDQDNAKVMEELASLMGKSRLERALSISDDEVDVRTADGERVEAKIRDYSLVMDMKTKTIAHDCGDWERSMETRQLCKHVGRVLLAVPGNIALQWTLKIQSDLESWAFRRLSDPP